MKKKNHRFLFAGLVLSSIVAVCSIAYFLNENKQINKNVEIKPLPNLSETENNKKKCNVIEQKVFVKKTNLFSNADNNSIPLSAIYEISTLPENIQKFFENIVENSNIYFVKNSSNKCFALIDNPDDIRHGLEFIEISLAHPHNITKIPLEIYDNTESENDIWIFDEESINKNPIKHTKLNTQGLIEFTEKWNYSSENPIKYEKENGLEKPISIKKETYDNSSNMRLEHLFYDEDANTKMSISIAYVGANLARFTYYNSENINQSLSIFSEFSEGKKIKETVYNSEYKVEKIYKATYEEDLRTSITVFNSENNKIDEILAK